MVGPSPNRRCRAARRARLDTASSAPADAARGKRRASSRPAMSVSVASAGSMRTSRSMTTVARRMSRSCPTKRTRRRPPFSSAPSRGLRAAVSASRVLKDNGGNYCSRRFQAVAARHRFDSNAHARTGRRPVARPNDSSKHCSASGPMRDRTRTRRDAHGHCDRSSAPITASGRTPRLDISRRVPVFQGLLNEQPC